MQSLENVPTWFSDYLDISLAAGQTILSIVAIMAVLLPVLYLSKGKHPILPFIAFFFMEAFLVGIGWLPFWFVIATVALMALGVATLGTNALTGN